MTQNTNEVQTKTWSQMVADENERLKDKPHLGGHYGLTHTDDGALQFLVQTFGIKSMVDIGCGVGGMAQCAGKHNIEYFGIDGDDTIERDKSLVFQLHDYSKAPLVLPKKYDLGWCVEFVEHVHHEYVPNFIATFQACSVVVMTYAPPKQIGHHHVNCMPFEYWLGVMHYAGFEPLFDATKAMREASTMRDIFMKNTGTIFAKREILTNNNIPITRLGLALP